MRKGYSPEIIANRLKIEYRHLPTISYEAIYQWIYRNRQDLVYCLLRCNKDGKRYKRGQRGNRRRKIVIKERVDITERSKEINNRIEQGDIELDLVEGKGKDNLKVAADRKSRLVKIERVINKSSQESYLASKKILKFFPKGFVRTLTYDNGTENALHFKINKEFGTQSFFCQPYSSWQKGTVENTNGLIRRFFPKGTRFEDITDEQIREVENYLNNRPRKCLNFLTPMEVFNSAVALDH
jgi:IS30 family transposase